MTRTHRSVHRIIWVVVAVVVGMTFIFALRSRAPAAELSTAAVEVRS